MVMPLCSVFSSPLLHTVDQSHVVLPTGLFSSILKIVSKMCLTSPRRYLVMKRRRTRTEERGVHYRRVSSFLKPRPSLATRWIDFYENMTTLSLSMYNI